MRWYDKHEKLGRHIDKMQGMGKARRDLLIKGVMMIIRRHNPNLLERFVLDFPLDLSRKRWYDQDPYLWLTINGLQYGDPDLLETIALYLEEQEGQNKR